MNAGCRVYKCTAVLLGSNDMLIFDQRDILLRNMIYLTDVKYDISNYV